MFYLLQLLEPSCCLHAVGQGALAVECREDDAESLLAASSLGENSYMTSAVKRGGVHQKKQMKQGRLPELCSVYEYQMPTRRKGVKNSEKFYAGVI